MSNLQNDILASSEHLKGAAIPVQDLHLTLFVLTLHEEDGSLQVTDDTLYQGPRRFPVDYTSTAPPYCNVSRIATEPDSAQIQVCVKLI